MQRDEEDSDEDYYYEKKDLCNTFLFNEEGRFLRAKDPNKVYDHMRLK